MLTGHVVRASPACSSWICHRNASIEKAWEDAAQGQGNQVMSIVKYITLSKTNTESKMNDETGTALFAFIYFLLTCYYFFLVMKGKGII